MTIKYFKFPIEEDWNQAALTLGVAVITPKLMTEESIDPETQEIIPAVYEDYWTWEYYTHDHSCDVIGDIYNNDGVYDQQTGEIIAPPTKAEGFHVNFIGEVPVELEQYLITPVSPSRKFAGY